MKQKHFLNLLKKRRLRKKKLKKMSKLAAPSGAVSLVDKKGLDMVRGKSIIREC